MVGGSGGGEDLWWFPGKLLQGLQGLVYFLKLSAHDGGVRGWV